VVACGCGISRSTNHAPSDAQIEKREFFQPDHDEKSKIPDERLMTYFCLKRNVFMAIDRV
jgi:hypothetical protein